MKTDHQQITLPEKQHREPVDIPLTARVLGYLVLAFIVSQLFTSCVTTSVAMKYKGATVNYAYDGKTATQTVGFDLSEFLDLGK